MRDIAEKQRIKLSESERKEKLHQLRELEAQLRNLEQTEKSPFPQNSANQAQIVAVDNKLLDELERLVNECLIHDHLMAALLNCDTILRAARFYQNTELYTKYEALFEKLTQARKLRFEKRHRTLMEMDQAINSVRGIIKIETDVAPEIESIPIEELLPGTSNFLDNIETATSKALETHHVQIKHEIQSHTLAQTTSGKAFELHQEGKIHLNVPPTVSNPLLVPMDFIADHQVTNPFNEPLDCAIIEDIIPYNYKITEIEVNNEITHIQPEKALQKEGLQLTWKVPPIPPETPIRFRYHLQPRVSRTIVVPMENELKIIKTHSSPDKTAQEGIYNTQLEFVNKFQNQLNGVVLEDRIPQPYQYAVQERKSHQFRTERQTGVGQVKWKLYEVPLNEIDYHEYRLIEPFKLHQVKEAAARLLKTDLSQLSADQRIEMQKKLNEAKEILQDLQK